MAIAETVKNVVNEILREVGKTFGTTKRAARRKRAASPVETVLQKVETFLRPARRQVSRAKTTRTRSTAQQRRVAAKTAKHRKSLRVGKARR